MKLFAADQLLGSGQLASGSSGVLAPNQGGLFLGGLPSDLGSEQRGQPAFRGCITDVILGDRWAHRQLLQAQCYEQ